MAEVLRPRPVGELINQGFSLLFGNFGVLLLIHGITWLPFELITNALVGQIETPLNNSNDAAETLRLLAQLGPVIAIPALMNLVIMPIAEGATVVVVADPFTGKRPSLATAFTVAIRSLLRLLVIGGIPMAIMAVSGVIAVVLALLGPIGLLLCALVVIAGYAAMLYAVLIFSVAAPVLVLEGTGITASLARSRALTRGSLLRIVLLFVIFTLISITFQLAINSMLGVVGIELSETVPGISFVNTPLDFVVNMIGTAFMTSLFVALYFDLRVRRDGFDLDNLAELVDVIATRSGLADSEASAPGSRAPNDPTDSQPLHGEDPAP